MVKYPFKQSKIKVRKPRDFFPVLNALVAPMFPEPMFLKSSLRNNFVKIKPQGTEPIKQEYKITQTISKFTIIYRLNFRSKKS